MYNAFLRTLEDGMHTADIYDVNTSRKLLGTKEFALAVVERLGMKPQALAPHPFKESNLEDAPHKERAAELTKASTTKSWSSPRQQKILHGALP